jgi:hypothetical protein
MVVFVEEGENLMGPLAAIVTIFGENYGWDEWILPNFKKFDKEIPHGFDWFDIHWFLPADCGPT